MGNPLLSLTTRPFGRGLRRVRVAVPTEVPATDAVFLVLRRMRTPIVVLIVIFTVSVVGLAWIPGVDADGNPARMSGFDAFYFMSYTATTIGFGEIPQAFTYAQRMWVTVAIYASVIGWAYSIGTLFALLQDSGFRDAVALQRFARSVRRIREPFHIVAGYGNAGRVICKTLDASGHRVVVIDAQRGRIEQLATDQLQADSPGLCADVSRPAVLGLAGLGHPHCEGVLAMTDDNDSNLNIVMSAHLLRPDLPVIARCSDRATAEHMLDFVPDAVINPYDRYGEYLSLALSKPAVFQLVTWLISQPGTPLPPAQGHLREGPWIVCADDAFGKEVARDLIRIGLQVAVIDPADGDPDVGNVTGLVVGTSSDTQNLATAAHARRSNDHLFLSVRQESHATAALLEAFNFDSVFVPTDLVAREVLARVATPLYWSFIGHALGQDDEWAGQVLARMVELFGETLPESIRITINRQQAPAVRRWLRDHDLTVGELLRHPDERERSLHALVLLLVRDDETIFLPADDQTLVEDDMLILAATPPCLSDLGSVLFYDATIEYLATGASVPHTWVWRRLSKRRTG